VKVAIGICCYNEEANIGKLLSKVCTYPFECIVIASGCTDNTISIAKCYNCKVITQDKREGKASAVNIFLEVSKKETQSDTCILQSADTLPTDFTYKYLLKPLLEDKKVGMVGCHPIPVNPQDTYINKIGHLLWQTHHYMALKYAKAGEVCAFRNIVESIDPKSAVDEVSIEKQIVDKGFKIEYAKNAIIFNKAPGNIEDFLKQRQRIYQGHLAVKDSGYKVATMNQFEVLKASLQATKDIRVLSYAAWLEYKARQKAIQNYNKNAENHIWNRIDSSKELK
jgi:poly-beta-1,6-N-acetyl-D-glucosamine synthase